MQSLRAIFLLISAALFVSSCASHSGSRDGQGLPSWVTSTSDPSKVICSAEGLDPQEVQIRAEGNCLASAARSKGVNLKVEHRTLTSLGGSDSSESVTAEPINAQVKCDFTNRYLEQLDMGGFRLWLQCLVQQSDFKPRSSALSETKNPREPESLSYKRALLQVTMVPQADKIIIGGSGPERVVEVEGNVMTVELHEGDSWVECRKQGYEVERRALPSFKHGTNAALTLYLYKSL